MDEEPRVLAALAAGGPYPVDFEDDLHRRLMGALNHSATSALDLGGPGSAIAASMDCCATTARSRSTSSRTCPPVCATVAGERRPAGDVAETAGRRRIGRRPGSTPTGARVTPPRWPAPRPGNDSTRTRLLADPFFEELTPFTTYRTAGQRAACRAAISSPEGATVVCMLPTGSGKTEIALTLSARKKSGVTVIIVPTLALAADFERRFRDLYVQMNRRIKPETLHFAWTSNTPDAVKDEMRDRIDQGQQPIVVTSPESMTRSLRQTMMWAAETGRFRGFVIDEAHLVTQWGRSFRPEFRTLADFRRDLLNRAAEYGHDRAVTLLLSATLGAPEMKDLLTCSANRVRVTPIVANALRQRAGHLDRPLREHRTAHRAGARDAGARAAAGDPVPDVAEERERVGRRAFASRGYGRIAVVTGETDGDERARVLQQIRADAPDGEAIDLVVATSAFGLGIDYAGIRTVVHACLPETVDRWYQEIGRGGRDGSASAEFLLTAPADRGRGRESGHPDPDAETAAQALEEPVEPPDRRGREVLHQPGEHHRRR